MSESRRNADPFADLQLMTCRSCRQPTDRLKRYEVIEFCIFLLFLASIEPRVHTACPRCMRKHLRWTLWINLLPANLLWPVYVLPRALFQIGCSYTPGHSRYIQRALIAGLGQQQPPTGQEGPGR